MKPAVEMKEITALTELLALNAKMEAASMGKSGENFAHVAEELKSLSYDASNIIQQQAKKRDKKTLRPGDITLENAINDQLQATEELFTTINGLSQTNVDEHQCSRKGIMNDLKHLKLTLKSGLRKLS